MEGAALRQKRELDIALFTAWHTAIFALNGYSGKLKGKSLSDFIGDGSKPVSSRALRNARLIAGFHRLQAQGIPVKITKNEIN